MLAIFLLLILILDSTELQEELKKSGSLGAIEFATRPGGNYVAGKCD